MRTRFLVLLLLAFAGNFLLELQVMQPAQAEPKTEQTDRKKKKKKKKKTAAKPEGQQTQADKEKIAKEKAKEKRAEEKKQAKRDKQVAKVQAAREKKNKKIAKQRDKDNPKYTDCKPSQVVRTSTDSLQLAKYIKIYQSLGGICYIIHLQKMAKLVKTADGAHYVTMEANPDRRESINWKTYLFCPIGKPDGTVALCSPKGDTLQLCSYQGEKKSGAMNYYRVDGKVVHREEYVNDRKVSEIELEEGQ